MNASRLSFASKSIDKDLIYEGITTNDMLRINRITLDYIDKDLIYEGITTLNLRAQLSQPEKIDKML